MEYKLFKSEAFHGVSRPEVIYVITFGRRFQIANPYEKLERAIVLKLYEESDKDWVGRSNAIRELTRVVSLFKRRSGKLTYQELSTLSWSHFYLGKSYYYLLNDLHLAFGNYTKTIEICSKSVHNQGLLAMAYYERGVVLRDQKKYASSISDLTHCINLLGDPVPKGIAGTARVKLVAQAYFIRSDVNNALDRKDLVVPDLDSAIRNFRKLNTWTENAKGDFATVLLYRGLKYIDNKQFDEAIEILFLSLSYSQKLKSFNDMQLKNYATAFINLAGIYAKRAMYKEAVKFYGDAIGALLQVKQPDSWVHTWVDRLKYYRTLLMKRQEESSKHE